MSYAYHYLSSFTAAAMVEVGMGVTQALTFHSFLFSIVVALCVYAFARRLTGNPWAAALGMTLFFLGGGFAWLLVAQRMDGIGDIWDVLRDRPWDGDEVIAHNYGWQNVYLASIEPQRAFLYGLPLCLLTFTLLHSAVQPVPPGPRPARSARPVVPERWVAVLPPRVLPILTPPLNWPVFATAGGVAGLLPFAHLGPLPLVAMVCLCLFSLFPSRGWVVFGAVWVAMTVPQLVIQGDGGGETFSSFRTQVGWLADPDNWLWFWWKNLGFFVPLLVAGFFVRDLFTPVSRRFLWAFMPIFVVANLFVFQPDPWDNTKLLTYWFLAGSIVVGAVLTKLWRLALSLPLQVAVRVAVVALTTSLVLSGLLLNLNQAEGHDRYIFLTQEELDLAARVRVETPTDAMFAVGLQHNHPVPVMSGRRVVMSYPGWLWPRGIDSSRREADLRAIYTLTPLADALIDHYDIDYVVIGPWEIQNFQGDPVAWRPRYPVVIETANYLVFAVRP